MITLNATINSFARTLLVALFVFGFGVRSFAQEIQISGKVSDKSSQEPLAGVIVVIKPKGKTNVVKFARTTNDGTFKISLPKILENHVLHFSHVGFASKTIALKKGQTFYNILLHQEETELKEVVVKAPNLRHHGDTIVYRVSGYAQIQDKSLADVLKKMPGIEVSKAGQIKYNGISINKFYIEGKDLLGGRYGIATNSIHPEDVGSVEVMENHQPIKAIKEISFSQNPAINIRLKEDAKARWVGTAKLGAGFSPLLWMGETAMMRFKKRSQTLNTYKSNNTGKDLMHETQSFAIDDDTDSQFTSTYRLHDHLSVMPKRLREIDSDRSRFNRTHLFTSNNLWSLGKNYDLTTQISYSDNRLKSDNATHTSYYLSDSTIITDLSEHAEDKQNSFSGDITLRANTDNYYFKNRLFTNLQWNDLDMQINGTYDNKQTASLKYHKISNHLNMIKRYDTKVYTINSYNSYQTKPQELRVVREKETQEQRVHSTAFYSNTNTSLSYYIKPVSISMKLGALFLSRSLETDLRGVSDTLGSLKNDIMMRYLNLYVSPEVEYKSGGFECKLQMPLSYVPYRFTDRLKEERRRSKKIFFGSRLFMRYYFTPRLYVSSYGRYRLNPLREQSFYEGLILNNYRNLSRGYINFQLGNTRSLNLNVNYRRPLKSFFADLGVERSWSSSPRISNRYFLKEYILNTFVTHDSHSDVWEINGGVSKGLDFINGTISVRSIYSSYNGAIFQNEKSSPFRSDNWIISPTLTMQVAQWCNLTYKMMYTQSRHKIKSLGSASLYKNLSQELSCTISPNKMCYIQVSGEHYYNQIIDDTFKQLFLLDMNFTYSFSNRWELNLSAKNIFDRNIYAYTVHNDITEMSREYYIRLRNIMAGIFFRF